MDTKTKFTLIALLTLLTACSGIRQVTYPPEFVYLTQSDIQSAMGQLANHVANINRMLRPSERSVENRQRIIDELNNMASISSGLGAGSTPTNHLLLDAHIDEFRDSIETARIRLQATPSDYSSVGTLVGSCSACHRLH